MKHLKKFNEELSDIIISENGYAPIIGYKDDIENNKVSLMNGYFTGVVYVGDESKKEMGIDDYSSPFHKGQVLSSDNLEDCEEIDFKYYSNLSKSIIRKFLEEYIESNYSGKIVKIIYH